MAELSEESPRRREASERPPRGVVGKLDDDQVHDLIAASDDGATMRELAFRFKIHRQECQRTYTVEVCWVEPLDYAHEPDPYTAMTDMTYYLSMSSVFEFFDDYILSAPQGAAFAADPDYLDVSLSLDLTEPLTPETESNIGTALTARATLLAHLTIPEVYEAFRNRGIDEIFHPWPEFADDYFEVEIIRVSLGSLDIDLRIKLSSKGKKAAKEHPHRFVRAVLSSFVTVITIWAGVITIRDSTGQAIPVPGPPTSVITACEYYASIPSVAAAKVKVDVKTKDGATVCTIRLTEPTKAERAH